MIRVLLVGAGAMGQAWLEAVHADPGVELAGVVDLDLAAARRAAPGLPVGTDVAAVAAVTGAQAVIDVTVPVAHHAVTTAALFAGLPVLGEKPVAETLAQALSLVAAAEVTGQLFMVSQSRRWNPQLFALRAMTAALGPAGSVSTDFHRAPRFGGFRERMAQPLLVDMAIHAFDAARFLLDADPVTVSCQTWNPPWSWYAGDACAAAVFEMTGGARCLPRQLVQSRRGDLVERRVAGQRGARHGTLGRRPRPGRAARRPAGRPVLRDRRGAAGVRGGAGQRGDPDGRGARQRAEPGHGGGRGGLRRPGPAGADRRRPGPRPRAGRPGGEPRGRPRGAAGLDRSAGGPQSEVIPSRRASR
jgi:predicted dehydrogenase